MVTINDEPLFFGRTKKERKKEIRYAKKLRRDGRSKYEDVREAWQRKEEGI